MWCMLCAGGHDWITLLAVVGITANVSDKHERVSVTIDVTLCRLSLTLGLHTHDTRERSLDLGVGQL